MYDDSSWFRDSISITTRQRGGGSENSLKRKPHQKLSLILIRRQTPYNAGSPTRGEDPTELLIAPSRIANLARNSQDQQVNLYTTTQAESGSEVVLQLGWITVGRRREAVREGQVRQALRYPANLIEIHARVDKRTDRTDAAKALLEQDRKFPVVAGGAQGRQNINENGRRI